MKLIRIQSILMLPIIFSIVGLSALSQASDNIRVEFERRGITAPLIDEGDYYMHPDGRKISFFRKKDVYVLAQADGVNQLKAKEPMQRAKAQFGDRVLEVKKHQLGHLNVIRFDNSQKAKQKSKQPFNIEPAMVEKLDNSITGMKPVFTMQNGEADVVLLSKVTLALNGIQPSEEALDTLKRKYNLRLIRKLKLSGDVYSFAFTNSNIEASKQFSQVRRMMNEPFVAWAEPQFYVKPIKEAFIPNDPRFEDQWNLKNRGFLGARCDADCDADNAWDIDNANGTGAVTGSGVVIAVIDDGVQLDHPDLVNNIWVNSGEVAGNGLDDDGNGYIDDVNGYDFVTDESATVCANGDSLGDGDNGPIGAFGQDSNPSPRDTANCVVANELLAEDDHGTAVAGILAAEGNNGLGIAGVAYNAEIMAVRAISDFDETPLLSDNESFCNTVAEAMEYAAQHADVINNSWSLPIECTALDEALTRVTSGDVTVGNGSKRSNGSTVVFASGNDASGWVKVTVPVDAGEHAYEWRLLRSAFPDDFDNENFGGGVEDDTVWLDDVIWSDGSTEDFESGISNFSTDWVLNSCDAICDVNFGAEPVWDIETRNQFVRSGTQSARIDASNSDCGNSYLHQIKDGPEGEVSFWVWVSTDSQVGSDRFEFLIDGEEVISYGDLAAFGFVNNPVAYPASSGSRAISPTGVIAVGASKSGDLSENGSNNASFIAEERVSYSQYGPTLDLVAPSSDQHLGITTTDRTGVDGYSNDDYTSGFGGTSAAAPVASGVAAAMLAVGPSTLSAADIRDMLRDSADEIGRVAYVNGRNDFHGYGRVNMYRALMLAKGVPLSSVNQDPQCLSTTLAYNVEEDLLLPRYQPQVSEFCPAIGALPASGVSEADSFCFPIITQNGGAAVICL